VAESVSGIPTSPGLGAGPAQVIRAERPRVEHRRIANETVTAEQDRFDAVVAEVIGELDRTDQQLRGQGHTEQARLALALVASHRAVLNDPLLIDGVRRVIEDECLCAEWALERVLADLRAAFARLTSPELRDWWRDVEGLAATLLNYLLPGGDRRPFRPRRDVVLVAHRLTVGDAIAAIQAGIAGVVLQEGSLTSHVAILCRSAGLPAVVAVVGACSRFEDGDLLRVNGASGQVDRFEDGTSPDGRSRSRRAFQSQAIALAPGVGAPQTIDGTSVTLRANLDLRLDADYARGHGTTGVGLMRTIYQYAGRSEMPGEDELAALYADVVRDFAPEPVSIRLLDLGGPLDEADLPEPLRELGDCRGIRLLQRRPEVVQTQLRALCRAAGAGRLRLLLPFVTTVEEVLEVRSLVAELIGDLAIDGSNLSIGAMVEVPAAVLMVQELAAVCDFLAIGTNDLSQFLFAIPREATSTVRAELPPAALLRAISTITAAGRQQNIDVCLCGEWASEPEAVPLLLAAGLRELSVSPTLAPAVRAAIEAVTLGDN